MTDSVNTTTTTTTNKDNTPTNRTMTDSANNTNLPPPPQTLENTTANNETSQPSEAAEKTDTTADSAAAVANVASAAAVSEVASAASTSRATQNNTNTNNGGGAVCVGRSNRNLSWGSCVAQGMPKHMEDFVAMVPGFLRLKCDQVGGCIAPDCKYAAQESPVHYFGLFDGHGGTQVSHYCSTRLHELLAEECLRESGEDEWRKKWEIALTRSFNRADDAFIDRELAPSTVGSTGLVVILSACQIIVANCGDSRAVLCRGRQAIPLTVDQKLDRDDEVDRLTKAGATILYVGCPRVQGVLNITRAIGDQDLKRWVISDPEVTFTTRSDEDECLILASDGLWDAKSNEEVMGFARRTLKEKRRQWVVGTDGSVSPAQYVSEEVVRAALYTSSDNISVIVVDLKRIRRRPQQRETDA